MAEYEMRSDSEIASMMKTIYIRNENPIDPEDLDHFSIDWNQFYDILFKVKDGVEE